MVLHGGQPKSWRDTMAKLKTPRLTYMSVDEIYNAPKEPPAQPCVVKPKGKTPFRVVPIAALTDNHNCSLACFGCIGEHGTDIGSLIDCGALPDCGDNIYVRATPANKLKHIEWLLSKD
jgi:hypothetical protein